MYLRWCRAVLQLFNTWSRSVFDVHIMGTMDLASSSRDGGWSCGEECHGQHLAQIYNSFRRDLMASVHIVVGSVPSVVMLVKRRPWTGRARSSTCICWNRYKKLIFTAFKSAFLLRDGSSTIVSCTSDDGLKIFLMDFDSVSRFFSARCLTVVSLEVRS